MICGTEETKTVEAGEHSYTRFVSIDPTTGEVWGCQWCTETETIAADHASGHCFGEDNVCKCGAEYKTNVTKTLAKDDFSTETRALNFGSPTVENGEWKVAYNATHSFAAANNADFVALLDGENNGDEILSISLSYKFKWTGTLASGWEGYRATGAFFGAGSNVASFNWKESEGNLIISEGGVTANPSPDTYHTATILFNLREAWVRSILDGIGQKTGTGVVMTDFNRYDIYGSKLPGTAFYIDDLTVEYVCNTVDTTNMMTPEN